ncbi:MAG: hypothetical protein EB010_12550 [Acidimicrobiia bacterium]|nr:hypothetical protein [Actinomycetota bacterium]NDE60220.1 hypothetical protein [Acidimicrobiia bacterium]
MVMVVVVEKIIQVRETQTVLVVRYQEILVLVVMLVDQVLEDKEVVQVVVPVAQVAQQLPVTIQDLVDLIKGQVAIPVVGPEREAQNLVVV